MTLPSKGVAAAAATALATALVVFPNGGSTLRADSVRPFALTYLGNQEVRVSASSTNPYVDEQRFAIISVQGRPEKTCLLRNDSRTCDISGLERGFSYSFTALIQCTVGPGESEPCFNEAGQEPLPIPSAVSIPLRDTVSRQPRPKSRCKPNSRQISNASFIWTCVKRKWQRRPTVHSKSIRIRSYPRFSPADPAFTQRPNQSPGVADIQECKIADARTSLRGAPPNVGFPLSPDIIPVEGKARFVAIPIDFADAEGSDSWLQKMHEQQRVMAQWFRYFSGGRLDVSFATSDVWKRAPRPSSAYQTGTGIPNGYTSFTAEWDRFAQEFIDASGTSFNWDGVDGVFFHFPEENSLGIPNSILGRGIDLRTPQGLKNLFYWGDGQYHFRMAKFLPNYWAGVWTHEALHSMGSQLHAPGNGFGTGVGQFQRGAGSWAFNAWEMFKAGWLADDQVFCAPANRVGSSSVNLRPLEVPGLGLKAAIVPLNEYQALVAESRRPVGYSHGWDPDDAGVFIYLLDTRTGSDRSNESSGADCGNDPEFPKWAYYLSSDQRPVSVKPPCRPSQYGDYLLKPGESVTRDGVVITYDMGGEFDTLSIRRPG